MCSVIYSKFGVNQRFSKDKLKDTIHLSLIMAWSVFLRSTIWKSPIITVKAECLAYARRFAYITSNFPNNPSG